MVEAIRIGTTLLNCFINLTVMVDEVLSGWFFEKQKIREGGVMVRWKKGRRVMGMLKVEERGYAIVDVETGLACAPNLFLCECRVTNTCTLCVFNL